MDSQRVYDLKNMHFAGELGVLIPALQRVQSEDGYISRARMLEINEQTGIPVAHIYGVATFYSQFRLKPVGKNVVRVCHGTACHVSGAETITRALEDELGVKVGETTDDRLFTLEKVSCLGCCSLAPVITVNETTHGNLEASGIKKALRPCREAAKHAAGDSGREAVKA